MKVSKNEINTLLKKYENVRPIKKKSSSFILNMHNLRYEVCTDEYAYFKNQAPGAFGRIDTAIKITFCVFNQENRVDNCDDDCDGDCGHYESFKFSSIEDLEKQLSQSNII